MIKCNQTPLHGSGPTNINQIAFRAQASYGALTGAKTEHRKWLCTPVFKCPKGSIWVPVARGSGTPNVPLFDRFLAFIRHFWGVFSVRSFVRASVRPTLPGLIDPF